MRAAGGIWAVVPVKELDSAKQRLAGLLAAAERRALAEVMLEEVLAALAAATGLAGVALVTREPRAIAIAAARGWRVIDDGARGGHTGAVDAGRRILADAGAAGILTLPGDVPATTAVEIDAVLAAHAAAPAFTIAPAHDRMGSNCVVISPPLAVPLRFGEDSYTPHLAAARAAGIAPTVIEQPGLAMDIDHPADLAAFLRLPQSRGTRTRALLETLGIAARLAPRA